MLTYTPEEGKKVGKIRIETKNPDYKVIYDNNMRDKYIQRYFKRKEKLKPSIKIEDVKLVKKNLKIKIRDYYFRMENGRRLGKLKIHVQVVNNSGKVYFDQRKTIVADKKNFSITLNLKNLDPGDYSIVVDVLDLLTDKSEMKYIRSKYK